MRLALVVLVALLCGGAICGVKGRPHPPRAPSAEADAASAPEADATTETPADAGAGD